MKSDNILYSEDYRDIHFNKNLAIHPATNRGGGFLAKFFVKRDVLNCLSLKNKFFILDDHVQSLIYFFDYANMFFLIGFIRHSFTSLLLATISTVLIN